MREGFCRGGRYTKRVPQGGYVLKQRFSPSGDEAPPLDRVADDAALMAQVARGDAAAFRLLVERHTPLVHGLAWRMLGDGAEAEDVVQEAFTRLWVGAARWTPVGGGMGGWLRRVATNLCLDRLRRVRPAGSDALPDRPDDAPLADDALDAERQRRAVARAISLLPDKQRAAIVLTYHEGAANAEAADILGIGVKALESLLVRARQALTRALAAEGLLGEDRIG